MSPENPDTPEQVAMVHRICPYLRDGKECLKCPEWEEQQLAPIMWIHSSEGEPV